MFSETEKRSEDKTGKRQQRPAGSSQQAGDCGEARTVRTNGNLGADGFKKTESNSQLTRNEEERKW
jgi:hypothetical protein